MQASSFAIKGNICFDLQRNRVPTVLGYRKGDSKERNLRMPGTGTGAFCGPRLGSIISEAGIVCKRMGSETILRSKAKSIFVKAQSSDGDVENLIHGKNQAHSSGTVLPYVGVACLGAILFGYHLGVVNGALEYLAKDLGIAENTVLQGWVVSTSLAGATFGSFTGGSLADKFGRKRTFQYDAIPLAVGAFLWLLPFILP